PSQPAAHPPGGAWPGAADRSAAGPGGPEGSLRRPRGRAGAARRRARSGGVSSTRVATLIGAPTDVGAADRGASMGPEALRVAGLARALRERELEVLDLGHLNG